MTQSTIKITLFALATLGFAAGIAPSVEARTVSADTFFATYSEMKRICKRYDHSLWRTKNYYGCGPARCDAKTHKCLARWEPPRQRPNCPPTIACIPGKKNPNGGENPGHSGGGGRPGGGQQGGGPNGPAGGPQR
jgi:hypothetical protein